MKKTLVILSWCALVLCIVLAIIFWNLMNNSNPEFEEVTVMVTESKTEQIVNRKTGSRTTIYKVKVRFEGKEQELRNPHNTYMYPEGKEVTAYLANGKLYANKEGVKTSTPVATIYYVFLFASFGMLFVAPMCTSKYAREKKEQTAE